MRTRADALGDLLSDISDGELRSELERRELSRGTRRPGRRMPSMKALRAHHRLGPRTYCVRCGTVMPTTELVRAHIIDRMFGGLDNAANLAPLCEWCHEIQPIFRPGDEAAALDWFGLPPLDAPRLPVSVIAALADALLDGADAVTEETFSWFWGDCGATVAPTPYHPMVEARRVLRHYPEWLVSC